MGSSKKLLIISVVTLLVALGLFGLGLSDLKTVYQKYKSDLVNINQVSQNQPDIQVREEESSKQAEISPDMAYVVDVIDGDTIDVEYKGEHRRLRYIGVNTPETVDPNRKVECFGKEASNENKRLLEGRKVFLEKDISETDKYGRLLRYIYLPLENGQFLFINDYLVREGFAQVSTYPPDVKYQPQFLKAQQEAKSQNKGLWARCKS